MKSPRLTYRTVGQFKAELHHNGWNASTPVVQPTWTLHDFRRSVPGRGVAQIIFTVWQLSPGLRIRRTVIVNAAWLPDCGSIRTGRGYAAARRLLEYVQTGANGRCTL